MVHLLLPVLSACVASVAARSSLMERHAHKITRNMHDNASVEKQMAGEQTTTTTAMGPNGETTTITVGVTITQATMGGSSNMTTVNTPPMAMGQTHMVTVGGETGLVYSPPSIMAAVGDMVHFNFMSQNHTVTQSGFMTPCIAMAGGADTGFMPNPNNTVAPPPAMMMQVTSAAPMWFYCKQKGHCGKGMVFSINPTATKTQAMFQSMAMQQNGTAMVAAPPAASSPAAPPPSPPPAATPSAAAAAAAAAPPAASVAAAPPPPAASAASPSVASGTGTQNGDVCSCSCLCGINSFPPMMGMGAFGGMSGSMPLSAASG